MQSNQITSIIDNCDQSVAIKKIINFFDPNRAKNRRTKILDCSSFFVWSETDIKYFDITKTRNLYGSVLDHKYDIIVFNPNDNKTFFTTSVESSKVFSKVLNIGGNIIVKIEDFKETIKGNCTLLGSFDIKTIFESNDLFLSDQIIFKNPAQYNHHDNKEVGPSHFLIFKKKIPV